jgi:MFS family permease
MGKSTVDSGNIREDKYFQKWDSLHNFFGGAIMPFLQTIAMLYLLTRFENTGVIEKTLLAMFLKSGMALGIPLAAFFAFFKFKINSILFSLYLFSGICLLFVQFLNNVYLYIIISGLIGIAVLSSSPVTVEVHSGYHKSRRGKLYSTTAISMILGILFFTGIANLLINDTIKRQQTVITLIAIPIFIAGLCTIKLPNRPFSKKQKLGLKELLYILINDKLFTYICVAWALIGTSSLWLLPYRTNILVEKSFGFCYSPKTVLFLLVILPEAIRILVMRIYAYFFDRINFIILRIVINIFFTLYIAFFFMGNSLFYHIIGMCFMGLGFGGGSLAWRLWVTKIAPRDKVPAYMAIHSGLSGIRMMLAPLVGLYGLNTLGPKACGLISLALIGSSTIMLFFVIKYASVRFNH